MELKVRILRAFEPCSQPVACPRIPEGEGEGGGPSVYSRDRWLHPQRLCCSLAESYNLHF